MRLLLRSATNRRPRESMASAWGMSRSPGPEPFWPQALMNLPLLSNFTMRALVLPPWPSATKMTPFGATSTADGALNSSGPPAGAAALAEPHQLLAVGAELDRLMALAVLADAVGDPDVAVGIDGEAVGQHEQPRAERLHELARGVEFEDRIEVRTVAGERVP